MESTDPEGPARAIPEPAKESADLDAPAQMIPVPRGSSADRSALVRAIRAALAESPPRDREAAERLLGERDATLGDEEFDAVLAELLATDEKFADRVERHLGLPGTRGLPFETGPLGPTTVPAIWWKCPEPDCTLEPEGGTALAPYRMRDCPDHAVPLVRA